MGDADYEPLADTNVPRPFRLREPGTALHIPGYEPEKAWGKDCIEILIKHFFHAIVRGKLEALVDGDIVRADTLGEYTKSLDAQTANFVRVSQSDVVAETHIDGIGDVTLRIEVYEDSSSGRLRDIALVRDAGMMITNERSNMGPMGLRRLPSHWHGFTVVIECLSRGDASLLRISESPEHNRISTDYISDPDQRKEAENRLRELGDWVKDNIREHAEPKLSDDPGRLDELARYLPIENDEDGVTDSSKPSRRLLEFSEPQQSNRPPRATRVRKGRTTTTSPRVVHGDGDDPVYPDGPRNPPKPPSPPRPPRPPGHVENTPTAVGNPRFKQGKRRPTHSVIATFDHAEALRDVQLISLGEDGAEVPIGISEAYIGEKPLVVSDDKIPTLDGSDGERISIEFVTREPVMNKTFHIKGVV